MNSLGFFVAFFEWLDISIYTIFPNTIIKDILSTQIPKIYYNTLFFIILSILMLSKIIGSYIFERFSKDRYRTLLISSSIISLSSILQAFLPTYNKIGIWSFISFIILTIIKGIAIGGNYNATIITANSKNNKYLSSSLITVGIFTGFLLIEGIQNLYEPIIKSTLYISFKNLNIIKNILETEIFNMPYISLWQTLFLISACFSFIVNLTFFLCVKKYNFILKYIKKITILLDILIMIEFITKTFLLKEINTYFYLINLLIPMNIMYLIIKLRKYIIINEDEPLNYQENIRTDIKVKDYIKTIILIFLEGIPFYYIFIFSYRLNIGQSLFMVKVLTTILTPIFAYFADKNYSKQILETSCFLITFSPILSFFECFYISIIYYSLMFSTCYSSLYGYLSIKLKKEKKEEILGISINIAQAILHFSIPFLSYMLKNNIIYLSIIFNITCSMIGFFSIKIIRNKCEKL